MLCALHVFHRSFAARAGHGAINQLLEGLCTRRVLTHTWRQSAATTNCRAHRSDSALDETCSRGHLEGRGSQWFSIAFVVPAGEGCGVVEELTECAAVRCSNARVHIHGFTPR